MPGSIQSIERAAAVLRLLAGSQRPLTLLEVSTALGLAKGTAHGILRTLVDVDLIAQERETGRYDVGDRLTGLSSSRVDPNTVRSQTLNWADTLAARTGEQVRVGVLRGRDVEVVHHVFRPDDTEQSSSTGALLPAHASAMGKALLASQPAALTDLLRTALEPCTHRTLVQPDALARQMEAVRRHGVATEVEELLLGQAAVAAPVRGRGGLVLAAVEVSGGVDRLCDGQGMPRTTYVTQVRTVARTMSRDLNR